MDPALRTSASGMAAQQLRSEVIANNLANVNTTGFKRSRPQFEDLLYQTIQNGGFIDTRDARATPAIQVGRGVHLAAVQRQHAQGTLEATGRPLDLAIEGDGFFQVQLPSGELAYTRDGGFQISDQGVLVTNGGYGLVPSVRIPNDVTDLTVSKSGVVTASRGEGNTVELGRIELARFANPAGLLTLGENLYRQTPASGQPVLGMPQDQGFGRLMQGSLEGSNVEIVNEMVDMISAMRAYEINSKAIKNADEMSGMMSQLLR
ncbi:MAG: flagellar basal-body rod protein FlgG [Gemmatimonadaceae bacterium]|jgi:flagellar basal-body rod protein FlgG|nr:flagellar basal-body rod protein FlgG [Gemmatimonadaceae bacterium]